VRDREERREGEERHTFGAEVGGEDVHAVALCVVARLLLGAPLLLDLAEKAAAAACAAAAAASGQVGEAVASSIVTSAMARSRRGRAGAAQQRRGDPGRSTLS